MVSGRHKVAGTRRGRSAHHADEMGSTDERASVLQGQFMCNRLQQIDECKMLPPLPLPSACRLSRLINYDGKPWTEYEINRYTKPDVGDAGIDDCDRTCCSFFLLLSFGVSRLCHCNWVLRRCTLEHTNIHLPGRCSMVVRVSDRHWTWPAVPPRRRF